MTLENLDKIIEGILFVNGNAVAIKDIKEKLELQDSEIKAAVAKLEKRYNADSGIVLLKFSGKLQMATNPAYVDAISSVLNPIKEKELSKACLETLAIVAYKQPTTRLEIEEVRGVSSDYTLQILEKNRLIEVVGRKDAIGKPLLFGTTEEFLKRFCLESIEALPDYDELLERLQMIERPGLPEDDGEQDTLYNHFDVPVNEEKPEFLDGEEVMEIGGVPTIVERAADEDQDDAEASQAEETLTNDALQNQNAETVD